MNRNASTSVGIGLTLASVFFLSWVGVLTQLAYEAGAPLGTVLSGRFLIAAAALWTLVALVGARRPDRRQLVAGLLLGVGYAAHAWLFSESLARLDAGLVDLLVFTYPALVMLGAVVLRRDRWSRRRAVALGTAAVGTVLVLVGGLHSVNPLGAALALAAGVAYAAYVLASAGQLARTSPLLLTALVTTGAAVTLTAGGAATSEISVAIEPTAFALIALIGLVAVGGMGTFVAGIGKLGPARASIVSAAQPALTPVLGFLVFADRLGPAQMLGGVLVVAAIVVLETGGRFPLSPAWRASLPRREGRALARATLAMDIRAGSRIVRQGSPAGAFFLIERGRATVTRDDRLVADLGPGEFFGEVALLQGGARTASVIAATDMSVRVIPLGEFGRAMRFFPTLARAARDATRKRLLAQPALPQPA
jgi:drug/metabolite transporter (DMT)-like permease